MLMQPANNSIAFPNFMNIMHSSMAGQVFAGGQSPLQRLPQLSLAVMALRIRGNDEWAATVHSLRKKQVINNGKICIDTGLAGMFI